MINRKLEETYTTGYTKDEKIIRIQETSSSNLIPLLILFFILLILALIIIILCCLYKACPFHTYLNSQKTKIMTDQGTSVKNHITGSGLGKESKSVQAVEWFNRKEAWTAERHHEEASTTLLRNNEPDSESYNRMRHTIQNQKHVHQDERDHMYIREGNADILRLITRDGLHQQPVPLKSDHNFTTFHSGKDLIMQQFMEQQPDIPMPISNPLTQLQTERELIQESLREQNTLLRQLIADRDLRLETQSLPACTQTDHDVGTQIEPGDLQFSSREVQTDNDQSDVSDEEIAIVRERAKKRNGRKSHIHRRIRTPIEEEVEFNRRTFETDEKPMFKHTKTSELRQKRASSVKLLNELNASKLGLRREVLQEIDESLDRPRKSESHLGFPRALLKHNSSSEDSSQSHDMHKLRYYSESDLTLLSSRLRPNNIKRELRSENNTDSEISTKQKLSKKKDKGMSRYMEWYYNKPKILKGDMANSSGNKLLNRNARPYLPERDAYLRNKFREGTYLTHKYLENNDSLAPRYHNKDGDDDSGIALARPPIADKKSVFTIAYNDMQTKQIRPDSTISQ